MMKDTGEDPNEEMPRVRSGKAPSAVVSVSAELGCTTLPVWMCLPTWKLSEHPTLGILWGLPHIVKINY